MGENPRKAAVVLLREAGSPDMEESRKEKDRPFLLHEMPGE
jgi:hypothetical protein